ncbi:hypothetical protein, partial [Salmonella enterica]|uniref:hypothetical protein n=1 Tax=Salmonella enterica TaxID=28901 RepID=UPI001C909FC4
LHIPQGVCGKASFVLAQAAMSMRARAFSLPMPINASKPVFISSSTNYVHHYNQNLKNNKKQCDDKHQRCQTKQSPNANRKHVKMILFHIIT